MWMDEWTKARKSRGRTGECTRGRKEEQRGDEASRRRRARGRREAWGRGQGARSFPCQQRAPRRPVGLPQFPRRESLRSAPEGWSALARWGRLGRGRRGPEVAGRGRRGPGRSRSPARPRPGEAAGPGPRLRGGRRAAAPGAAEPQPRSQVSAEGRGPGAQVQRARGTRGGPARSCGRGGHPPRPPWSHLGVTVTLDPGQAERAQPQPPSLGAGDGGPLPAPRGAERCTSGRSATAERSSP